MRPLRRVSSHQKSDLVVERNDDMDDVRAGRTEMVVKVEEEATCDENATPLNSRRRSFRKEVGKAGLLLR